jgi:hypothetical protein
MRAKVNAARMDCRTRESIMSIKVIGWAFDQPMPASAKLVLLKLADNADAAGLAWPSVRYISRKTGLSERTIRSCLRYLEKRGFITTQAQISRRGQGSNRYILNWRSGGTAPNTPSPRRNASTSDARLAGQPRQRLQAHKNRQEEPSLNHARLHEEPSFASWIAEALQIAEEIGTEKFYSYFEGAEIERGVPTIIWVRKKMLQIRITEKFTALLKRVFGCEVVVRFKKPSL